MRTSFFAVLVAIFAAGCVHFPRSTTWTGGEVQHRSCVGRDAQGNCVIAATAGDINGDRLPSVVTATANGEATVTDAHTRATATQAQGVRQFRATDALAAAYQSCMQDEGADAMICGAPFVVEAANGNSGGVYSPYGMAGGFPTRTVRALGAVYGGYAPLGGSYPYAGGRRGGEAVDSVARSSVAELAGALREHTDGGGR